MTYDAVNQIYVSHVPCDAMNLQARTFPRQVEWDDRLWLRDVAAETDDAGYPTAMYYVLRDDNDLPEILCLWGDGRPQCV